MINTQETKNCKCKTKHCKHYESDFERYIKDEPQETIEGTTQQRFNGEFVGEYLQYVSLGDWYPRKKIDFIEDIQKFITNEISIALQKQR